MAAWAHEGNGTTGANGHYSTAVYAASQPGNDPYAGAEAMVSEDWETLTDFTTRVRLMAQEAGMRIANYSSDASGNVSGNWSGTLWIWNYSTSQFYAITMSI